MFRIEAFDTHQWKRWTVGVLHTEDAEQAQRYCDEHTTGTITMTYFGLADLDAKPLAKTMWVASWLPAKRPQSNENDDETPRFGLRHTEDGAYDEAAGWVAAFIQGAMSSRALTAEPAIAGLLANHKTVIERAIIDEDWRAVVRLYNEHNEEGWYIYVSETPVGVQLDTVPC